MHNDRDCEIIQWAQARRLPWYTTLKGPQGEPELKVHCGCVTAYFRRGDLVRIQADAEEDLFDDFFQELTQLFARRALKGTRSACDGPRPCGGRVSNN
ncbi:MAG: hypothetical protein IT449_02905 [Phycisphaerales bacterium]|nr:hypothetical protein [Phycisphaerales bacterium]